MSIEDQEPIKFSAPTYEIDTSKSWDTESRAAAFFKGLRKLKIYKKGLLYSGFDGNQIDQQSSSNEGKDVVFCSKEENLTYSTAEGEIDAENAFEYADEYDMPAIAIYDPNKMERAGMSYEYRIKEPSALIAIIILK